MRNLFVAVQITGWLYSLPAVAQHDISHLEKVAEHAEWPIQFEFVRKTLFVSGSLPNEKAREEMHGVLEQIPGIQGVVDQTSLALAKGNAEQTFDVVEQSLAQVLHYAPYFAGVLVLLILFLMLTVFTSRLTRKLLRPRLQSSLLVDLLGRLAGIPVMIFGLVVILKLLKLEKAVGAIIGGTGLLGLVIGFAFKDIAENFLASVLISIQRPFSIGDYVIHDDYQGLVLNVNLRSTVLMTLDGNHVQIPNSMMYKSPLVNTTANPKTRITIHVGIGYETDIARAQSIASDAVCSHPAVLKDPEPMVIAERMGSATIELAIHFCSDTQTHSSFKAKSALLRHVKQAYEANGVSMPDDAREVIFPQGITMHEEAATSGQRPRPRLSEPVPTELEAEGELTTELRDLEEQAHQARNPEYNISIL